MFFFNEGYLECFKVMCASMLATRSFLDLPIIIYSDEGDKLRDDAFVSTVADTFRDIEPADYAYIDGVDTSRVPEKFRYKGIPKYTFLKWLIFQPSGYDELIFLDCDMICLRNLDNQSFFTREMNSADLLGCREFPQKMLEARKSDPKTYLAMFEKLMSEEQDRASGRLNSGVMRIGKRLLTGGFFDQLIDFASRTACVNEQSFLTSFFRETAAFRLEFHDSSCNVPDKKFDFLRVEDQIRHWSKVSILHFNGNKKPWADKKGVDSFGFLLWRKYNQQLDQIEASLQSQN